MVICSGRNIVVDVLIYSDLFLRQFSDNELLIQLCISVIQLLSKVKSYQLESINL